MQAPTAKKTKERLPKSRIRYASPADSFTIKIAKTLPRCNSRQMRWPLRGNEPVESSFKVCCDLERKVWYHWVLVSQELPAMPIFPVHQDCSATHSIASYPSRPSCLGQKSSNTQICFRIMIEISPEFR